jgi:Peptidase family S41
MARSTAKAARPKKPAKAKKATKIASRRRDDTVKLQLTKAGKAELGDIVTLADFLATAGKTTREDRLTIIDQAIIMIDQTYVHLPLKRAMHAIEPVQRLRLVKQRLDSYTERAFHNEMISIFLHLRDLHTNYILPEPFRSRVAFLPFHIEECFEPVGAQKMLAPQYVVTEVMPGKMSVPDFKPGVVVTHWSGIPIETAVEVNADREAGSNLDARHLQGLQTMTNRWMGMSLPPDEEWVTVRYLAGSGAAKEARFDWQVFQPPPEPSGGGGSVPGADRLAAGDDHLLRIGIDAKAEMQRRVRKLLFAPEAVAAQKKMTILGADASRAAQAFHSQVMAAAAMTAGSLAPQLGAAPRRGTAKAAAKASAHRPRPGSAAEASALAAGAELEGVDLTANSIMPDVFKQFGTVTRPDGAFGYIRIVTFAIAGDQIEPFIREFIRIAALLPQDGLIVDVRGNGGGTIAAGEGLLQTMTPVEIEPERFHLINTPLTLQMCEQDGELADWRKSAKESVEIGSAFTQGFPLTPHDFCNSIGQTYQGPVVLIVDAGCYSTTDMFAAGFQDHGVGRIIGTAGRTATSGHTGAGGANVWEHGDLERTLPPKISPFKPIPAGASFRVAIRRSMRVGLHSGEPLEDLGVVPDEVYPMTRNDLLNHNGDLIAHACGVLATMPRQRLTATCSKLPNGSLSSTVVTSNVQRVDMLLNGRPVQTLDVKDGSTSFNVVIPAQPANVGGATNALEYKGFRNGELVVGTRLQV